MHVLTYILTKQIIRDLIFKKILQCLRCLNNPIMTGPLMSGKTTNYHLLSPYTYKKWLQIYVWSMLKVFCWYEIFWQNRQIHLGAKGWKPNISQFWSTDWYQQKTFNIYQAIHKSGVHAAPPLPPQYKICLWIGQICFYYITTSSHLLLRFIIITIMSLHIYSSQCN